LRLKENVAAHREPDSSAIRWSGLIEEFGDVGVNANDLSHASNSVISSSLAIRFIDDVVIPRNRATDAAVYSNFRTVSIVFAWPQYIPFLTPCQVLRLLLFLFEPISPLAFSEDKDEV
jgi:hypothetical protein